MFKRGFVILLALTSLSVLVASASAQDDPISDALQDCSPEIESYCSSVTPGEGRLVSCVEDHRDKLSSQCKLGINRAAYWVNFLAASLRYVAIQCEADVSKHCPNVDPGEKRLLNCLKENRSDLSRHCDLALLDIGQN